MNFRTTVILLVLLALALGFYVAANWSGTADPTVAKRDEDRDIDKGRKLLDVKADDVRKVVVRPGEGAPAGSKPIELTQADGKWTIVQPISWPADSFEGRNFVDAFASARTVGSVDLDAGNAASTGLAKPRFVVELTDAAGKVSKLAIGDQSALGHLYVQANDEKAGSLVSAGPLRERFGRTTTDKLVSALRDKQILKLASFDVKQVEVSRGGTGSGAPAPALALQKAALDWKLTAPVQEPAESSEVSDLISAVTSLRAEEFVDEASASSQGASFDRPRAVVTLSAAAPSTQPTTAPATGLAAGKLPGGVTVVVGQPVDIEGEKAWVKVSGPGASDPVTVAKVTLNQASVDKLTKATPLSLRDRRVFTAAADQVSEVTVTTETPTAGGATQPSATHPSTTNPAGGAKTVRLARRKEHMELGPFLPKGPATAPAATQPAGPAAPPASSATSPAATPTTQPATKPSARLSGVSPVLALVSLLQADPAPAATPPAPTPVGAATRPTTVVPSLSATDELSKLVPATRPIGDATASPATRPAATQPAATQPAASASSSPATAASAATATQPAVPLEALKPPTQWVVTSAGDADADDAAVTGLLTDLNPLRAAKYLEKAPPATQPAAASYTVTVKAVAAGGAVTTYEVHITDPGGEAKPIGRYNDLVFEVDREVVNKLKAEFAAKKP